MRVIPLQREVIRVILFKYMSEGRKVNVVLTWVRVNL